ncbi:MAG: hypothetical protein AAGK03_03480 [Pseudomonadota bacterium]
MSLSLVDPLDLLDEDLLTVEDAITWLGARGIKTSRSGLDRLRGAGLLKAVRTRGRIRLRYRRADLAAAFIEGEEECRSSFSGAARKETGTSGARSRDAAFMKALELANAASRRRR